MFGSFLGRRRRGRRVGLEWPDRKSGHLELSGNKGIGDFDQVAGAGVRPVEIAVSQYFH
jgi:hypothetical protein